MGRTSSGKKTAVGLNVTVASSRAAGLDLADAVADCFGVVGKQHRKSIKLAISVDETLDETLG